MSVRRDHEQHEHRPAIGAVFALLHFLTAFFVFKIGLVAGLVVLTIGGALI